MSLFNQINRTELRPKYYSEPIFRYLNISANPRIEQVRLLLEKWFTSYPQHEGAKFISRFQSVRDEDHLSSFYELFLHELLLKHGYDVAIEAPPPWPTQKVIDFKATSPVFTIFVEATLLMDDKSNTAFIDKLYDLINGKLNSPDYFLMVDIDKGMQSQPSAKSICAFLERMFTESDYDDILRLFREDEIRRIPRWSFPHESKNITFTPIPKSPIARGTSGIKPIGISYARAEWVLPQSIISKLEEKGSRYGTPTLPYVIAINVTDPMFDKSDIEQALFGFDPSDSGKVKDTQYQGLFTSTGGPKYTRISGILISQQLLPWTIEHSESYLVLNPWAGIPLDKTALRVPVAEFSGGKLHYTKGLAHQEIFGMP
jgi:hypothetical protein